MGKQLARERDIDVDLVIPVPDSGTAAALGYAEEAGLPFQDGLMKTAMWAEPLSSQPRK